jgi:type IV secretory pathway VirB4 component
MPLFVRKLGREQVLDTTSLAYSFFFDANNVSMPAGPVWGYTVRGRRPVLYDQRNQALGVENPHVAIIAPSGTGKSVAFASILTDTMVGPRESRPDQVVLIDPKKDYERFCDYFGGTQIRWEVGRPRHVVNALQLYPDRHLDQQMQDVLGLIALATTTETNPLSPEDYAFWEWALRVTYERFGILREDEASWLATADGAPRTPTDFPTLRDLLVTISEGGECDRPSMVPLLRPWATGIYAGIFARHTTTDLSREPLVVFDLEGLTHSDDALKRLRPMATYLISLFIWGEARATRKKRILGTDEVATLLAYPATAHFFGNLLAMGRSYGLSVFHMSQQYTDYTQSKEGRRAITSTATKLLLKQVGGENINELIRDFQLTAGLRDFVLNAKVGTPGKWGSDGLMVTPRGMEAIEILPPPEVLELMRPPDSMAVVQQAAAVARAAQP